MTVEGLIKLLQTCHPAMRVFVDGYESGFDEPRIRLAKVKLNANETPSVLGRHDEIWDASDHESYLTGVIIERHQEGES